MIDTTELRTRRLIEVFGEALGNDPVCGGRCAMGTIEWLAEEAIRAGEAMVRKSADWRPFPGDAPKDGSVFLVYSPRDPPGYPPSIDQCEWDEGIGDFIKWGCGLSGVTHWRPMLADPRR